MAARTTKPVTKTRPGGFVSTTRIGPCDTQTEGEPLFKMYWPREVVTPVVNGYTGDYEEGDEKDG